MASLVNARMFVCRARLLCSAYTAPVRMMSSTSSGEWGSGAGKGGGSGGSIREAGGTFGKMEAAREEEYFRRKNAEQLAEIKKIHEDQISYHEEVIKHHQESIDKIKSHHHYEEDDDKDDKK
ncbi:ATPase inhibitor A, mitochondrial isoform X2 [Lingula anatina]|uniref:ATP synthase F1 subunit epsilon n=1 Tax=Lingula anatina TaxID=7574 RepID=A0A2R2MPB0_LINAN|nr:ATPase inhibitor A, mitochondrial isoform X2 [Lingula anatina]|eukprot:XP_023932074.1 ATPase inhibitor A, mitochondrial isoform X2 [Lingula anatina]